MDEMGRLLEKVFSARWVGSYKELHLHFLPLMDGISAVIYPDGEW